LFDKVSSLLIQVSFDDSQEFIKTDGTRFVSVKNLENVVYLFITHFKLELSAGFGEFGFVKLSRTIVIADFE
jgi:hypothetical protein